jgi:hypothetical protein
MLTGSWRDWLAAAGLAAVAASAAAELTNEGAPVIVGHYHLNVTSIPEHRRFWVDTLGGKATKIGSVEAIEFPDVYLLLHEQPPTGPTRGTTFDHIGFAVPDVPALTTKVVANGYALTVGREPAPGETASPPTAGNYGRFSYLIGPDGVKVELVTNATENAPPIVHHHVHFVNRQFVEMQQWYLKAFNATLRDGQIAKREVKSGLMMGVTLGIVGFFIVFGGHYAFSLFGEHFIRIGFAIGTAVVGVVLWGTIMGSMLPLLLKRLGADPATSSTPFIATLVDVTGLLIYFGTAFLLLKGVLL